jgi:ABC-type dipeptide transport system, periplasmic component
MRKIILVCMSLLLMLSISACSPGGNSNSKNTNNGPLLIGIESEADVLDPQREGGWVTFRISHQIYESLVSEDLSKPSSQEAVPKLKPSLATSWKISKDGLVYTFYLRKGVKFQDGTSFNAQAVAFNIQRDTDKSFKYYDARSAGLMQKTYQSLKSIKVLNDYTIQLTMKQPFSPFLRMLAQGSEGTGGLISPAALKKWGNDKLAEHPVGTGPFKFKDRVRGQKIELVRNNSYWGKKPYINGVTFVPIPDPAARVQALESGQVDMIAVPSPDSISQLKKKGFQVVEGRPPHVWYLSMNYRNKAIQDKRVRQAIAMAIDRKGMAQHLLKDTATPAYSIQSPGNSAYDPNFVDYKYDPSKAKQLLKEAGYGNGLTMTFETSTDGSGQLIPVPMAEWIQRDLAKVGINLKLKTYEWVDYLGKWQQPMSPNVGFNQMSWGFTTPYFLSIIADSKSASNPGQYNNPQVDKWINEAVTSPSQTKAINLWKKVNNQIAADASIIPVINDKAPYVLAPNVKGFVVPSEEWYDLTNVQLTK